MRFLNQKIKKISTSSSSLIIDSWILNDMIINLFPMVKLLHNSHSSVEKNIEKPLNSRANVHGDGVQIPMEVHLDYRELHSWGQGHMIHDSYD